MSDADDLPDWNLDEHTRTPATVVPLPASTHGNPRGRRLMVGLPGLGWRGDLRGDAPVVQGSRTYVPVLPEIEWYRAEAERIEVFAPLVPIDRVWVESLEHPARSQQPTDLISRLVSLDAPASRTPIPAREATNLTGRRLIQVSEPSGAVPGAGLGAGASAGGERRDLRAVTEPFTSADGDICVRLADELDWYRWAWSGQPPKSVAIPIHLLWVE